MTTAEMEQPAKQWQIEAVILGQKLSNDKLDQILEAQKNYVTHADLEEAAKKSAEYTDAKVEVLNTKYGPIYKLFWALIVAVCVQAALLVFQLNK
jgi:hypothetical protein